MRNQISLTGNELKEYIEKEAKGIIKSILSENKKSNKKPLKLRESTENGLWTEIIFVQSGDDIYDEIDHMFCGDRDGYCEANSQPVIDYLKQWDDGESGEVTPNQPRIARYDTSYEDENGDYTLLYNSTVGGCFLLYRPATDQEADWYNDKGDGSMRENKQVKKLKESVNFNDYAEISNALENCGWSYTDAYDVRNSKTGQIGIRYVLSPNGRGAVDSEELESRMTDLLGADNVVFSQGTHRYAPELTNLSMVVLDNEEDSMEESKLHNTIKKIVKKSLNKKLNENMYNDQWEEEIKLFFKGLIQGKALVDNDIIAVEWGHNDRDPRYIYYRFGDNRLTDDHFSAQYSRPLTDKEMTKLKHIASTKYGVEIPEEEY